MGQSAAQRGNQPHVTVGKSKRIILTVFGGLSGLNFHINPEKFSTCKDGLGALAATVGVCKSTKSNRLSYYSLLSTLAQPANGIGHSKQVQFPANAGEGLKKELANFESIAKS